MSKETAWLELFTGVAIDDPITDERQAKLKGVVDAAAEADDVYARKKRAQADALAVVRAKLELIKVETKQVLEQKIPSGPFKGQRFLDVQGGQIKEIDVEDVSAQALKTGTPPIPMEIIGKLQAAGMKIADLARDLREMRFQPTPKAKNEKLFSKQELQEEYWTPVMRERIFPEGFIPGKWSATQQMLDATNALYEEMVEQKRLSGELTPERDFVKDSLETAGKVVSIAASVMGNFSGDELELAQQILETGSEVMGALAEMREKLKNNEFTDVASLALDIAGAMVGVALAAADIDGDISKAATGAIKTGSAAVLLGKTLHQVRTGEANLSQALGQMGEVLGKALTAAAAGADGSGDGEAGKALAIAAKAAPSLFKSIGLGTDLPELVKAGDYKSVIERLAVITKEVLKQLPGLDKANVDFEKLVDIGAAGLAMTVKAAMAAKKGQYLQALNGVIDDVGESLGDVLGVAGVDDDLSGQIVALYKGAASAPKAFELMRQHPPKIAEAVTALAGGIESALGGTGDDTLKAVGTSLAMGVKTLVNADQIAKLYKEEKFDEAVALFSDSLADGFDKLGQALGAPAATGRSDKGGEQQGDEASGAKGKSRPKGEAGGPDADAMASLKALVADMKKGVKVKPEQLQQAAQKLKEGQEAEQAVADRAEAEEMLAEAQMDLKALTDAERTGAEASNIEQMIGDLLRERMILKLATQIAQGGAAFLAQFLPGLGAVSAGIKLAASLVAAGQRAQQLDLWIKAQSDLQAAQSALSSSASNFVRNQGQQLAHYAAQAFFAAAQLAGEITKLAGPASGIGAAISGVAAAGAKAEDLLMDLKKKYDVETGWKATKKALSNPGNRRMGLEARALNPTLAKYSLAWGAVVLKDPLARGAMKACGLSEATLGETTDAHKVVKYLEVFYEDDVSIYRVASEGAPAWVPVEIEISLMCWAAFRRGAQGVQLEIKGAGVVEGLFGEYEGVQEAAAVTSDGLDLAQTAFTQAGKAVRAAAAKGDTDNPSASPTIPDTTLLETAIDEHAAMMRSRSDTAQRLHHALVSAKATPTEAGAKGDAAKKVAVDVLYQFCKKAERVSKAAALDAAGLETAKMDMLTTVAVLKAQIAAEKAKKAKSTGKEGVSSSAGSSGASAKSSKDKEVTAAT